jgi:hypothetical protein
MFSHGNRKRAHLGSSLKLVTFSLFLYSTVASADLKLRKLPLKIHSKIVQVVMALS